MKRCWRVVALVLGTAAVAGAQGRSEAELDSGWKFLKGDAPHAEAPEFDDSRWGTVNLPHDWSIAGPFDEKNPTKGAGGFLPGGTGWYRKQFQVPGAKDGRHFIEFDGVMANSEVWVNGASLGKRPNGYVSFRYELTPHLNGDAKKMNVVAVRVDNSAQPASRWYTGAGIYRHVRLISTNAVHFEQWSTVVTTPQISAMEATVRVHWSVVNQSDRAHSFSVHAGISGPTGVMETPETKPISVAADKTIAFEQEFKIPNPRLWEVDRPAIYQASLQLREGGATVDLESTPFGIREFHFDPATGFWLNGKNFKIRGVCLHHDAGALGAAVPASVWERRLTQLKAFGVNAVRTAHNPADPQFLTLCDRMGMLVMEEMFDTWKYAKNPYDYHLFFDEWASRDTGDTVRRDRNHPSIILYSAGNEIRDTPKAEMAKGILAALVDVFHRFDPTRPVTQALFRPNASHDYDNGLADMLDVIGQNYREDEIVAAHDAKPTRKIIGTENGHDLKIWQALRDHPAYAGQFLWTGFDYLGESRAWPRVGAGSGLFDRTGRARPLAFQRKSWWSTEPVVYMARRLSASRATPSDPGFEPLQRQQTVFGDWTPTDAGPHEENVEVYSNCESVELLLNGKSLGSKPRSGNDAPRVWAVPFEAGTIQAVGKNNGKEAARHELRTAGKAAQVLMTADRASVAARWDEVVYVRAVVADVQGIPVPGASDTITFEGRGPVSIVAVDSGDNNWHDSFQQSSCKAFDGECVAIVRANSSQGTIAVIGSAAALKGGAVTIEASR